MFVFITIIDLLMPLLGFCISLFYFNASRKSIISAILCGLAFSAAFYGYIPDEENDIYRHMESLIFYQNIHIYDCFNQLQDFHLSTIYFWDIYMWIVAQLGNPYLLQAGGAFLGYSLISFMIFDLAKRNRISFKNWLFTYLIGLSSFPFLEITVGIRSANAFIFSVLALYLYYIRHKRIALAVLPFVAAIFFHHGVIILLGIWLLLPFFYRFKTVSLFFFIILLIVFYQYQSTFYAFLGSTSNDFVQNTVYTSSTYSQLDFNNSFHALVSTAWRILYSIIFVFIVSRSLLENDDPIYPIINKKIFKFAIILIVISIGLMFVLGNNGLRYMGVVNLLCCILLEYNRFCFWGRKSWNIKVKSTALFMGSLGCYALYLYDMSWGTGSLTSFLQSLVMGYMSRNF